MEFCALEECLQSDTLGLGEMSRLVCWRGIGDLKARGKRGPPRGDFQGRSGEFGTQPLDGESNKSIGINVLREVSYWRHYKTLWVAGRRGLRGGCP
jgi:hypothetical protein